MHGLVYGWCMGWCMGVWLCGGVDGLCDVVVCEENAYVYCLDW